MAQAGATDVSKVDEALSYASEVVKSTSKIILFKGGVNFG